MTPEECIVASLAVDPEFSISRTRGILNPEHFSDYSISQVYEKILKMRDEGVAIDPVTVSNQFKNGFRSKILNLCVNLPTAANVDQYRDMVIRDYHERKLKEHYKKGPSEESVKGITEEWQKVQSVGVRRFDFNQKAVEYAGILEKRSKSEETIFPTGFPTLDFNVPLLKRGEMAVVGARTSTGKTSLLLGMMLHMAKRGVKVMFVSGEMSFNQLMDRIVSLETGIPLMQLRKGVVANWSEVNDCLANITALPIRFVEASKLSFEKFMPELLNFKPDIVFIDYIQRFNDPKITNRAAYYSDVANSLKGLSVQHDIAVICSSQISRNVEHRKSDEPRLSDLKESGGLEEAADVVWMIHLPEEEKLNDLKQMNMLILKNRNGPTFNFQTTFSSSVAKFSETE